jgi:predicted secreted protein
VIHGAVLVSAFAIFWFLALFCLLPMGLGAGVDPDSGAPTSPKLAQKLALASGIAALVWGIFYALIVLRVINL